MCLRAFYQKYENIEKVKNMQELEKKKCRGCDYMIAQIPQFEGMYCNEYCCVHCPDAKIHPCQKEKKFGTPIENLYKLQNEVNPSV